ncbi:hypothetical protein ACTXT7_005884 [Hymenolepis weldensis]
MDNNNHQLTIKQLLNLQNYVTDSRTKNRTFKEKRSALNNLSTEKEIVMKTLDLLEDITKEAEKKLDANEALHGMNGYLDLFDNLERATIDDLHPCKTKHENARVKCEIVNLIVTPDALPINACVPK